jgi:hypothetical protein
MNMKDLAKKVLCVVATAVLCSTLSAVEVAIDIEVAMVPGVPITAPQEWAERLGKLGLAHVQIRSARGDEKPSTTMNEQGTRVSVIAVLTKADELIVPQRKFRVSQLSELREYFENLPTQIAEEGIVRGPFRLTEREFHTVMADLAKPIVITTAGKTTGDLVAHCRSKFRLPIKVTPPAKLMLQGGKPLPMEMETLAAGTALAIALRRDNLAMWPEHIPGGLQLVIEPYERDKETWPIGWKVEGSPRQLVPTLYEPLTIEIDGYTLTTALEALAPRLTVPVIMDDYMLTKLEIDPAKVQVKVPAKKTYLKGAIDRIFSQAHLACELRTDDRGTPFLWGTQFGPDSRPAK